MYRGCGRCGGRGEGESGREEFREGGQACGRARGPGHP